MRCHRAIITLVTLAAAVTAGTRYRAEAGARRPLIRLSTSSGGFPSHTCMVPEDGTVWCWGNDFSGQLGDGVTLTDRFQPVQVNGLYAVSSVAAGANHTCALLGGTGGAGVVRCWGQDSMGQVGNGGLYLGQITTPTTVSGLDSIVAISAGMNHTCALRADGDVWCWGDNTKGQLGNGACCSVTNLPVRSAQNVVAIAAGGDHTCAVIIGGAAECWGDNSHGQVSGGPGGFFPVPAGIAGLPAKVVALSLGTQYTCALLVDGTVRCWGANDSGQLGDGTAVDRYVPVTPNIGQAVAISAGGAHTCAILVSGAIRCWGFDANGQLGDGKTATELSPVATLGITNAVEISAGTFHTCATDSAGAVHCWGYDLDGELGNGFPNNLTNPVPVAVLGIQGGIGARGLAAGNSFNCARRGNGGVSCWGNGVSGQLGNGAFSSSSSAVNVSGLNSDAINLSAGGHACAVRVSGTVSCWGLNSSGQLGDGSVANRDVAVPVGGIVNAVQVAAGGLHTCVLLADGTIRCWGSNLSGQLGNPVANSSLVPVPVTNPDGTGTLSGVISISAGNRHTCAVLISGIAWCWGDNSSGQLGDNGVELTSARPVFVQGLIYPVSISAGQSHACAVSAILLNGGVSCWGDNSSGQLGDSTTHSRSFASWADTNGAATAAGHAHSCDVHFDGSASCWGDDSAWQLAASDTSDHLFPVPVISGFVTVQNVQIAIRLSSVTGIATGASHTCALFVAGGIDCWGSNANGQLGNGSTTSSQRPVAVNSFTANVKPGVTLHSNGRITTVTALVNCPIGGEAHIFLTLEQDSVSGSGAAVAACASGLVEVPMTIPADGPVGFQPGPATAKVEAIIKDQGQVTEDQHWTRAVILSVQP